MIYELWIIAGLIAGIKNRFKSLSLPDFQNPLLLILPFIMQVSAMLIHSYITTNTYLFLSIVNLSYFLLLMVLWNNRHVPGFLIFMVGALANALVIWSNDGRMPVSIEAMNQAGLESYIPALQEGLDKHQLMDNQTNLPWLGDWIPLIRPYGEHQVISIGDVIQSTGITLLVWYIFSGNKFRV
jgi:hypothetical protein